VAATRPRVSGDSPSKRRILRGIVQVVCSEVARLEDSVAGASRAVYLWRLGWQCPYAGRAAREASALAAALGMPFVDRDVTGRPEEAAAPGAYHSFQVDVPGYPAGDSDRVSGRPGH
jgi:hypothetical protein